MDRSFTVETLGDRVVAISGPDIGCNAGAVVLPNFSVVIDPTMIPSTARQFRRYLEEQFHLPVKFLFLTHSHTDHVFGMGAFKDTCIVGSYLLTQHLRQRNQTEWTPEFWAKWKQDSPQDQDWLDEVEIVLPTLDFQQTLVIRDGDLSVELHHVGGHSECSAYAYVPHARIAFLGDLLFAQMFPYAGWHTCDPERWMVVLEELLALEADQFVPGHGPVVGKAELEKELQFLRALKQATLKAIAAGKGPEAITIPEYYPVLPGMDWIKTQTLERFYTCYQPK